MFFTVCQVCLNCIHTYQGSQYLIWVVFPLMIVMTHSVCESSSVLFSLKNVVTLDKKGNKRLLFYYPSGLEHEHSDMVCFPYKKGQ